jgi:cobalamin biosynthesis Co2+ chelatase CbiK
VITSTVLYAYLYNLKIDPRIRMLLSIDPVSFTSMSVRRAHNSKKLIDELKLLFYYHFNTGKEVIGKYMSSNYSEVAET